MGLLTAVFGGVREKIFCCFLAKIWVKFQKNGALCRAPFSSIGFRIHEMTRQNSLKSALKNAQNNLLICLQVEFSTHLRVTVTFP